MQNQTEQQSTAKQQPASAQSDQDGDQQKQSELTPADQHSQDTGQQQESGSQTKEDVDQADVDKMRGGWADERVGGGSTES